ncbi:hypothetical protein VH569_22700 [Azospirillum sp. 11R-A]|uniref:hypothetical protein n=1 Tax=Azospirillum sp. 11R-A TaxID=3111634 RepID=UPI003C23D556
MTDASATGATTPTPVPFADLDEEIATIIRRADRCRVILDKKLEDPAVRRRPSSLFAAHCLAEAESGDLRYALELADQTVRTTAALLDEAMSVLRRQALAASFYARHAHDLEEALAEATGTDPHRGAQQ